MTAHSHPPKLVGPLPHGTPSPVATMERVLWQVDNDGDPHTILGVDHGTSPADIQKAYLAMVRLLHPDQPTFIQRNLTADATRAMAAVNSAHTQIENNSAGGRQANSSAPQKQNADPTAAALILINNAKVMLDNRSWAKADETLQQARGALKGRLNSRCDVLQAWAMWNNPERDPAERDNEALALLRKVSERQGESRERALAHFYMAMRLRIRGREDKAMGHAQKATQLDPRLREAESLLRLLMRREERGLSTGKQSQESSLWGRLFGRK